jgi:hypothetical protein
LPYYYLVCPGSVKFAPNIVWFMSKLTPSIVWGSDPGAVGGECRDVWQVGEGDAPHCLGQCTATRCATRCLANMRSFYSCIKWSYYSLFIMSYFGAYAGQMFSPQYRNAVPRGAVAMQCFNPLADEQLVNAPQILTSLPF